MKKNKFFNFKIFTFISVFLVFLNIGYFNLNNYDKNFKKEQINSNQIGNIIEQVNGQQVYSEESDQIYPATSGALIDQDLDGLADTIYMWGDNEYGQIGINDQENDFITTPQKLDIFKYGSGSFYQLESSGTHSGVVFDSDNDGKSDQLYMWGDNRYQQLVISNSITDYSYVPMLVDFNWEGDIISLELSYGYSGVTIDTNDDGYAENLYIWGNNEDGQIGNGEKNNTILEPTLITPKDQDNWGGNIIDFEIDGHHSAVTIDTDYDGYADTLYSWGANEYGQVGNGEERNDIVSPTIITPQNGYWEGNLIDLELGSSHSGVTVDTDYNGYADTLYMWGDNYFKQLGNINSYQNEFIPTISYGPEQNWGGDLVNFSLSGINSSIAVDTNNDHLGDVIYLWGDNSYGQIGNGIIDNQLEKGISTPTKPLNQNGEEFDWNGNVINIDLGGNSSSALIDSDYDGLGDELYLWGDNSYGQLGNSQIGVNILTPDQQNFKLENFKLENYEIIDTSNYGLEINITLEDNNDFFNKSNIPTLKLKNQDQGNIYNTTYDFLNSDPESDSYSYKINNIKSGQKYQWDEILINDQGDDFNEDLIFNINEIEILSDYKIKEASISEENITESDALIDLDFENKMNFNINNFTEEELKVRINYQDQENQYIKETIINQNEQILLDGLNSENQYTITSIDYFYQNGNYKYTFNPVNLVFWTDTLIPTFYQINNTFEIEQINSDSFQFKIGLNNVIVNEDGSLANIDNVYLIDSNNNIYEGDYVENSWESEVNSVNKESTVNSSIEQGYARFNVTQLSEKTNYNFIGISFQEDGSSASLFQESINIQTDNNFNFKLMISIILIIILAILLTLIIIYFARKYKQFKKAKVVDQDEITKVAN
ncbi:RCC1 domain-containing protein [Candidatus Hepatoplasma crinochetorum]|uniref:RCC1 domain-containing protein n=1 Tax=Candidatus Hepatoplasma crinochetorum TaxID=295596 RepID=UPI00308FEEAD|nr:MAG: hypothetical protein HCTKY_2750 [Candidatus Hepatoplasma crinochetorum]